jgi:hypothetical protein
MMIYGYIPKSKPKNYQKLNKSKKMLLQKHSIKLLANLIQEVLQKNQLF